MQKIIEVATKRAGASAPAAGGIGPMTTASLLRKKLFAAARRRGVINEKI